jgi:type VI protein secretion system component VasK
MLTNVQLYLAIGLPVFSILVVWLGSMMMNNRAINALSQRIDDLRSEMRTGTDDLRSEMRTGFDGVNGRLDRLETRFDRIEDEVRKDHEGRLARLEARVFARTA